MIILFDFGYFYLLCVYFGSFGSCFVDILGGHGIKLLTERRNDGKLRLEAEHGQIHARVHGRVQVCI